MQFFINASGCKGKISEDIQYPVDHTAIIRRMTEEFDEVIDYFYYLLYIIAKEHSLIFRKAASIR